jgi:hypothetical protein
MSAPQPVNPLYLGSTKNANSQPTNPLSAFWQQQVIAPQYRAENLKYVHLHIPLHIYPMCVYVKEGLMRLLVY